MKFKKSVVLCSVTAIITIMTTHYQDELKISKDGLELIGNAEGCMRDPYHCPSDVLTVGIGSTQHAGLKIEPNKIYTDDEIAKRWLHDLKDTEQCILKNVNHDLPQPIHDATTSLVFNIGCGNFRKSTLLKRLNNKQYNLACNEFIKWKYAGGRVLKGLEIRRKKEQQLCLTYLAKK